MAGKRNIYQEAHAAIAAEQAKRTAEIAANQSSSQPFGAELKEAAGDAVQARRIASGQPSVRQLSGMERRSVLETSRVDRRPVSTLSKVGGADRE